MFTFKKTTKKSIIVSNKDQDFEIFLRRNKRAKRLILRQNINDGQFALTLPPRASITSAENFCQSHIGWILNKFKTRSPLIKLKHGQLIPLRGEDYKLIFTDKLRGKIEQTKSEIIITGGEDFAPNRLKNWLKLQAKNDTIHAINKYQPMLNVKHNKLTIRDTKSRWGSCSSQKNLSFSWRLIMAPSYVLDYVVAHELAHILEMNHSPKFWAHVNKVCPHTKQAQNWLKENGSGLHVLQVK